MNLEVAVKQGLESLIPWESPGVVNLDAVSAHRFLNLTVVADEITQVLANIAGGILDRRELRIGHHELHLRVSHRVRHWRRVAVRFVNSLLTREAAEHNR